MKYINHKVRKFNNFARDICKGEEKSLLLVTLSNDYKTLLTNHSRQMSPLTKYVKRIWSKLSSMEKCNFNEYGGNNFWTKELRLHINCQFLKYQEALHGILKNSNIVNFLNSLVLKRIQKNLIFAFILLFSIKCVTFLSNIEH